MRKQTFISIILLLSIMSVQEVKAQFFKRLGEVAGAVLGSITEDTENNGNANNQNSSSSKPSVQTGNQGSIPYTELKVTSCEYWGNDVLVRFLITSSIDQNISLLCDADRNCLAYDDNNNTYEINFTIANKSGWGYELRTQLPGGIPVKGYVTVKNVATTCKAIKQIKFTGTVSKDSYRTESLQYQYSIGYHEVEYPKNTNADNIFCSFPILTYKFNKIYRSSDGKDLIVDATVINNGTSEYKIGQTDEGTNVYDSEGNSYSSELKLGGKNVDSWTRGTLLSGVPMKFQIVIKNVPKSVTEFSQIKTVFKCNNDYNYYVKIRNQKVQ